MIPLPITPTPSDSLPSTLPISLAPMFTISSKGFPYVSSIMLRLPATIRGQHQQRTTFWTPARRAPELLTGVLCLTHV